MTATPAPVCNLVLVLKPEEARKLIPCCAWCGRLTVDHQPVGEPIDTTTGPYTHGLCQECAPSVWEQARRLVQEGEKGER